jgi:hypothetical protein
MAVRTSTGLLNALLVTGSFRATMNLGFINIYSGSQPASANDAVPSGSVLLATIRNASDDTTGLTLETVAASGVVLKEQDEVWREDSIIASGIAGWFRYYAAAGNPAISSTTEIRLDGAVGTSGAQLNLGSVNLVQGAPLVLDNTSNFSIA